MLRARIGITTEAVVEIGKFSDNGTTFVIHDAKTFVDEAQYGQVSDNNRIVDIIIVNNGNNLDSYFPVTLNLVDMLFDKIAYVGYSRTILNHFYSLGPLNTKMNDVFDLLVPQYMLGKQREPVKVNDLKNISLTKKNRNAIRLLQIAINSNSSLERYISLYSALEWLADKESNEKNIITCENCGFQKNTGRNATNNYLLNMFERYGKDKKDAEQYKIVRAKIAHGSGARDSAFMDKVTEYSSYLEEMLIQELDKNTDSANFNGSNVISSSTPYYVHTCKHDIDGCFSLINSRWTAPIKFTQIKTRNNKGSMSFGAPLGKNQAPIIDPISWPNYQNA